jgi:hypothetical protein
MLSTVRVLMGAIRHREDMVTQSALPTTRRYAHRRDVLAVMLAGLFVGLAILGLPATSEAWPAVQDPIGVHLCNSRPLQRPDGLWTCRSGSIVYEGSLVEVSQGPSQPPFGPYVGSPRRGTSGYDELDPWLEHRQER